MTTEHQDVSVLSPHGEPRGLQMTEETFEPAGLVLTVSGELDIATAPPCATSSRPRSTPAATGS